MNIKCHTMTIEKSIVIRMSIQSIRTMAVKFARLDDSNIHLFNHLRFQYIFTSIFEITF